MSLTEVLTILTAAEGAAITIITLYFKNRHDELKLRFENLCSTCEFSYTPKK
jgi:hypoxanthine-guanine phosphoribosyltransferase